MKGIRSALHDATKMRKNIKAMMRRTMTELENPWSWSQVSLGVLVGQILGLGKQWMQGWCFNALVLYLNCSGLNSLHASRLLSVIGLKMHCNELSSYEKAR